MAIKYIRTTKERAARGLVKQVYRQVKGDFGAVVEPFALHAPLPGLLAGAWCACRESLLAGGVRRALKEAVATAVSRINRCPYCVDAHSIMLIAGGDAGIPGAIGEESHGRIEDPEIRSAVEWALATRSPDAEILRSPPFSEGDRPEIIGTAVLFHYINRMVSVMLTETPLPSNMGLLKGMLKRVAGLMFSRAMHRPKEPGLSLSFLPEAEVPEDMAWAGASPVVSGAFSRWDAAVQAAGEELLAADVRDCLQERINQWNGEDPGLGRAWVDAPAEPFDKASASAVQLGLLTALAPYQVDDGLVKAFISHHPGDERLVGLLAWSSYMAARRISTWLQT